MTEKGLLDVRKLPDNEFNQYWDSIKLPEDMKEQMVRQIVLSFKIRGTISFAELPLHGIMALLGPPGTGKTSIARAVASKAAEFLGKNVSYIEVEPHALASSALGRSQKDVRDLLMVTIREKAANHPTIVLLDEVETLAADRNRLSLEANPVDVHRATDAVLASLDVLARENPKLVFLLTSNFEKAVDQALLSRADVIFRFENPNQDACKHIITDTLSALGREWPGISKLALSKSFSKAVEAAVGLDGRKIRKSVFSALSARKETVTKPELLSIEDLTKAFKLAHGNAKKEEESRHGH
jgi:AAA+ superfamily predicted ATPase